MLTPTPVLEEVILFTNGTILAFDQSGMMHPNQEDFNSDKPWDNRKVIRIILQDNPKIKISRWKNWIHDINKEEFFLMTNRYKDYQNVIWEETQKEEEETQKKEEETQKEEK